MKYFAFGAAVIVTAVFLKLGALWLKPPAPTEQLLKITVPSGATFANLLNQAGVATDTINAILESSKKSYDLSRIVSGRELALTLGVAGNDFKKLVYKIDSEEELVVASTTESGLMAEVQPIPYEVKEEKIAGTIETSLYEAFLKNNWDVRLALALAETFAWQVDFAADIRTGDSFKVIYEKRFLNGEYTMPGKILAAEFINDGEVSRGYHFEGSNTKKGYYDEQGNSLQKQFLKSPLQYKYISSGFSYARLNPVTKKVSPHRGIDYAANYGTPAVSVGDGTVIQAGWNSPYGLSVVIRHNETYTTRYGHFQNLARGIRVGAKVKQGQVVGYVGSTGEATGPHLHYEMHKFGNYVNPFKIAIPPGQPINENDKPAFEELVKKYGALL